MPGITHAGRQKDKCWCYLRNNKTTSRMNSLNRVCLVCVCHFNDILVMEGVKKGDNKMTVANLLFVPFLLGKSWV
jgi:hypothetical protein